MNYSTVPDKLVYLIATPDYINLSLAQENASICKEISEIEIKKISALVTPPGIMALVEMDTPHFNEGNAVFNSAICLESIKDREFRNNNKDSGLVRY